MLPPTCFTCGMLMSDIELEYEKKLNDIENDGSLNEAQKHEKKVKLIDSFGLKRYCCRMRLLGYVDKINIII
jgi:DNA-directed RNA polymerase subunit N